VSRTGPGKVLLLPGGMATGPSIQSISNVAFTLSDELNAADSWEAQTSDHGESQKRESEVAPEARCKRCVTASISAGDAGNNVSV
jgi:hypothetical protein